MSTRNIEMLIRGLDKEDDTGFENLANMISETSWKEPRELVNILHNGQKEESQKASIVLLNLGDLIFTPLLDSLSSESPDDYVWDMQSIMKIQLENRAKIAKILNNMLLDKRPLKLPLLPGYVEEKPIPRRVCDEAYLMLRHLLSFEEDEETLFLNEDLFLNMTDEEKDREILRAKSSKRWIPLTEQFFEYEEKNIPKRK